MNKWKTVRLGDVASYLNGYPFKPSDWSEDGLPIIRIQDLTGNSYEINRYSGSYNEKYEVNYGDVLISWSASLGVYEWTGEKALLNQHIFKVIFNKMIVNKRYFIFTLSHLLNSMSNQTHGSTMKHITKPRFDNTPFPLPPLVEQQKIAAELDKISGLIAKRKSQIEKLDLLVKAKFVEMFGDPVTNPMGWNKVPLSDCLHKIENGKSFVCKSDSRKGNNPAVLKLSAVTYGAYDEYENKAMIGETDFCEYAEVKSGDLLFTRKNTPDLVGMAAYVYTTAPKLMMPDLIFRLCTTKICNKIYLWKLINHELFRNAITGLANGSAKSMSNISKERLNGLIIPLPPLPLQIQFADFVQKTEQIKITMQKSLVGLETLYKARMQEYFE